MAGTSSSFESVDHGSSIAQNRGTGHTVFLSHSGMDKDFVGILEDELEKRSYEPFFDKKSLPIGDRVSMDAILELAKTCKLGVIVLSDDFFSRTKNPMLELATFVKHGIPLLPLFCKLTVGDVKNQEKKKAWMDKWRLWSTTDTRINIFDWECALDALIKTTGLEYQYRVASSNFAKYARLAADEVCSLLPPDICPSDERVQGKERLCQAVKDMFANAPEFCGAKVLALWGMEGVGKTTLCKALRKSYHKEFSGRVCYVQFASQQNNKRNQLDNIKTICFRLTKADAQVAETQIRDVCQGIAYLENHLPSSKKFLLILDNVHKYSLDEAKTFILDGKSYPRGSHILFLGRSYNYLARLLPTIDNDRMIHRFPRLHFEEAERIFLNKTLFLDQNESDIEQHQKDYDAQPEMKAIFNQCINLCTFKQCSSDSSSDSYNPKMLELLASYLPGCNTQQYLGKWKNILSKLEKDPNDAMKGMFELLQESYDALNPHEKDLFLDLALYTQAGKDVQKLRFEQEEACVDEWLRKLTSISFWSKDYGVQHVHRYFARDLAKRSGEFLYAQGQKFNLGSLRSMLFQKELLAKDQSSGLKKLAFVNCTFLLRGESLDFPDLPVERPIRVLLLDNVQGLASLKLQDGNHLRRMEMKSTCALHIELASTISLTVDQMSQYSRLPLKDFRGLVILELQGGLVNTPWKVDAAGLSEADSLKYVKLHNIELTNSKCNVLELSCWPCLEELKLSNLTQATLLSGWEKLTALSILSLTACNQLSELQLPGSLRDCCIKECEGLTKMEVEREELTAVGSSGAENCVVEKKFIVWNCKNLREIMAPEELRERFDVRPKISVCMKPFYDHEGSNSLKLAPKQFKFMKEVAPLRIMEGVAPLRIMEGVDHLRLPRCSWRE